MSPYIFTVNILFLIEGTVRVKKNIVLWGCVCVCVEGVVGGGWRWGVWGVGVEVGVGWLEVGVGWLEVGVVGGGGGCMVDPSGLYHICKREHNFLTPHTFKIKCQTY